MEDQKGVVVNMKASELIYELGKVIAKSGDLDVFIELNGETSQLISVSVPDEELKKILLAKI